MRAGWGCFDKAGGYVTMAACCPGFGAAAGFGGGEHSSGLIAYVLKSQPTAVAQVWGWAFLALAIAIVAGGFFLVARWSSGGEMVEIALPTPTPTPSVLAVHVAGAVKRPGVYQFLPGQRVMDAIAAAGGAAEGGDPQALNLAAPLRDGQKLFVPLRDASGPLASPPTGKIAINSATAAQLEALPLIGAKKAQDIVAYRQAQGPFQRLEDLLLVPGIGSSTLEQIRDLITLD